MHGRFGPAGTVAWVNGRILCADGGIPACTGRQP